MIDFKLKLPREEKDENGFTPSQNRDLEKYIATMPSAKESKGAWKAFVERNKKADEAEAKNTQNKEFETINCAYSSGITPYSSKK